MTGAARIQRGGGSGRRPVQVRGNNRNGGRGNGRQLKRLSRMDRFLAMLPVSERTLQRGMTIALVGIVLAGAAGAASFFGLPEMARMEFAQAAARAGFEVDKVEVRGVQRMDELDVYNIALGQVDRSMVNLDLPKVRDDLMKLGWVKDARVSRRLPDTLVVDIVEREPVAVWQNAGKLALIDSSGTELQPVEAAAMPDLPLVVGPNANRKSADLGTLLDAAPALKPLLAGATWVGDRRWDLRFQSGETLSLPEGDKAASTALVNFARMDGVNRLLGRGIVRFDMRDPDKFVLRLPSNRAKAEGAQKASGSGATAKAPAQAGEG